MESEALVVERSLLQPVVGLDVDPTGGALNSPVGDDGDECGEAAPGP
jgi:hypothetical protein